MPVFKAMCLIPLLIFTYVFEGHSAKILGVFPNSGYSQYILGSALMKGLAERGHEVTMISGFSQKVPVRNLKEISTKVDTQPPRGDLYERVSHNWYDKARLLYDVFCLNITETTLSHPNVQKLLNSEETFDLVILEIFISEAYAGFAYRYKAPFIFFSSIGASEWTNHLVANPAPFSYVPVLYSGYSTNMSFWQRLRNSMLRVFDSLYRHLVIYPKHERMLQKYFPGTPKLQDLIYNSSLILLNSHGATNLQAPLVPNMIEIGGFHISPKPLPADLQEFLDGAKEGAVFFSMGSNLRSKDMPKERVSGILKAFSKLKQRVLWKWEGKDLPGKSANVKIAKWLPQQNILAHPNIRVFITHGGLLSTTEGVYSGVPMISVPVFGDQTLNTEIGVNNGVTIKIELNDFNEECLSRALNEILTNTSYREAAQLRSKILQDQAMSPLQKAMFWVEYVLRHKGATHLRSAALNLTWYQYLLLDVIIFVITTIFISMYICKVLLRKLFCNVKKQKKKLKEQ